MNDTPTFAQKITLQELLLKTFERFASDFAVCKPGSIISYVQSTNLAKVQPGFKVKPKGALASVPLPAISGVPVIFPQGSWGQLRWNLSPGDTVLLIFADRNMNSWEAGSGVPTDPLDSRQHSIGDAIAIPGLLPIGKIVPRLFQNANLELVANGPIAIGNGKSGTVTGVTPSTVNVEVISILDALLQLIQQLTVTCAGSGSPSSVPLNNSAFAALQGLIDQLKPS